MICPKCEEGKIIKVFLKTVDGEAMMCDFCETVWLRGEEIKCNTGHPFNITRKREDLEYTLGESEDKDQEHRSAEYTHIK